MSGGGGWGCPVWSPIDKPRPRRRRLEWPRRVPEKQPHTTEGGGLRGLGFCRGCLVSGETSNINFLWVCVIKGLLFCISGYFLGLFSWTPPCRSPHPPPSHTQRVQVKRGMRFRSPIGGPPFEKRSPKGHQLATKSSLVVMLIPLLTLPFRIDPSQANRGQRATLLSRHLLRFQ